MISSEWYPFVGCFVLTIVFSRLLMLCAPALNLVVNPGEHRQHSLPTPLVGGIAMVLSMAIVVAVYFPHYLPLFAVLGLLLAVGVADDISNLPSSLRILLQAAAMYLLIEVTGVRLETLGYLFGDTPILLGRWSYPLTIFAGIGVINALNMTDGMDGLAGSLVLVCCFSLLMIGSVEGSLIMLLSSAILGFLVWNLRFFRRRAALFMGDAGSTSIGLLLTFLFIRATQPTDAVIHPVTALWIIAVPLIDTVALLVARPLLGRSPFAADNLHYHHMLQRLGLNVNQTLLLVVLIQAALAVIGVTMMLSGVSESIQLACFLLLFLIYLLLVLRRGS